MAAEERRRHERFPLIVDCRIEGVSGGAAMRVTDISLSGCYVDTAIPFPEGANITVSVMLGEAVALSGRIIHTQPSHGFGVALVFNDLKEPARWQLIHQQAIAAKHLPQASITC